jgi:hypothetical protein
MADRTILLAQNKRHATRGLSVVNPQEFLAYQEDDDNLTYIVDMGAYLDGATIVLVTRTPTGVVISNASNTTTRLTQRLAGYGHVDFRVQTSAGDTEQFRVYIQPRAANPAFFLTAGSGGGITALDGDKGDVIVSSAGSTWTLDPTAVASLNVFTSSLKGITPASGGGTTNFLRADGTWAAPPAATDNDYGDITVSSSGTVWTIDNNAVTLAKMADMATASVIYRKSAGTGDPEVNTLATLKTDLGLTGTNSGDQTITLTGDVTGSGTGSFVTAIGTGVIVNTDVNASAAIDATKLSFLQAGSGAVARTVDSKLEDFVSIRDFGGSHDGREFYGAASITGGTAALTVTGGNFTSGDVGKLIYVRGAGAAGATLATTVSAYTSATQVTLAANASTTVSNQDCLVATNDGSTFTAVDSIAGAKYLPGGLTGTSAVFNTIDGPYFGRGQLIDSGGNKRAPWVSRISSPRSRPANAPNHADSILTQFNGDLSGVQIAMEHWVTGATTLGQPTTGYRHNPETAAVLLDVYNSSGYNHSNTGDSGRTMTNGYYTTCRQYGQGDITAYQAFGIGASNNPSATHWSANPAIGAFAADVQGGIDHVYLNPVEINCTGNNYTVSAVGGVFNLFRGVDSEGGQNHFWTGVRVNSQGPERADVGFQPVGLLKHALDLSYANLDSNQSAITLKANQRIYGDVTANDASSRFPTALNGAYFTYSSSISAWNFIVNNSSILQIYGTQVVVASGKPLGLTGSTSGATLLQASATASGTLTLPAATDTLVGRATTDTLSNKTLNTPTISGDLTSNGWATFASANAFAPQLTAWNQVAGTSGGYFKLRKSRGASGAGSATVANDTLGSFLWSGHDTTGAEQNAAYVSATALTVTGSAVTAFLQFNANGGSMNFGNGGAGVLDINTATGEYRVNGTKVVGARDTGWTAMTGTANENTSYATGTITLVQLAERVKAIQDALTTHGLIGT